MNRKTVPPGRESQDDLVVIGEITKAHGIHGEVKVHLYSDQPGNFKEYKTVVVQTPAGGGLKTYDIVRCREQGRQVIVHLHGIETRDGAEAMQGSRILLHEDDFPVLDSGEYYWHQLQGLKAETETGRSLGTVARLFNAGAHDIMVVSGAGGEFMIPVTGEIIRDIDRQGGKVVIAPPPGLLEMNK